MAGARLFRHFLLHGKFVHLETAPNTFCSHPLDICLIIICRNALSQGIYEHKLYHPYTRRNEQMSCVKYGYGYGSSAAIVLVLYILLVIVLSAFWI